MNKARRRLQKGRARLRGRRLLECVSRRLREMRRDRRRREDELARRRVQKYTLSSTYGKTGRP